MNTKNFLQILFPFSLLILLFFYLSAPFPNDSPGCCSAPANNWLDFPKSISCDTQNSSSCINLNTSANESIKRLCALYLPNSDPISECSKISRVATCSVRNYSLKKIYYSTGSTPWDENSAGVDCTNLGGELE